MLGYTGDGVSPLYVDFQACSDSQDNDWGEYTGRLYIPSTNQCVTVTNQSSSNAPYYPAVAACQSTPAAAYYAQHWDYREEENGALRWVRRMDIVLGALSWLILREQLGKTDWEGSTPQGDCGQFGYEADASGVPTLTSSGQVTLGCYEATVAFKLSSATD